MRTLAAALLVAALGCSQEPQVIRDLDAAERLKKDVLKLLFDRLDKARPEEVQAVIGWLSARETSGEQPYLYLLGLYHGRLADAEQKLVGVEYLAKAALVYRVAAEKCGDSTALEAVPRLEGMLRLEMVRDGLKQRPEMRRRVVENALAYEEKSARRPAPAWACAQGAFPGSPAPLEADLQEKRRRIRATFEESF
jgi:hypothetical protein